MSDFMEPAPSRWDTLEMDDFPGFSGRRRKAAIALTVLWSSTLVLHLVSWGSWFIWGLTFALCTHAARVLLARPMTAPPLLPSVQGISPEAIPADWEEWPFVSILVAAKNEEAVITPLVKALCSLDYPPSRFDLWVIDDNSTDKTPYLLEQLSRQYPQLNFVRRPAGSTGGKSGALNDVWPDTQGSLVVVFDADAHVPQDLLRRVVPMFADETVGAVQVRKAIRNAGTNLWTRGQQAEMALDSYFQQQRIAVGGIGELRGNGQFVRRLALEHCGGWSEETITDDLDLTLRLHLHDWDVQFLLQPAVREEGVTHPLALWHQRNRWAEGGYQRYLDYWRLIAQNRLPLGKAFDLFAFWLIQYGLPTVALPDFLLSVARGRLPVYTPVSTLALTLSMVGMYTGLQRTQPRQPVWVTLMQTLRGTLYMLHWFLVIAAVTVRLSLRPKRLRWVKTTHLGLDDEPQMDASS